MTYAQSEDTDQLWHLPSLISRRCPHEEPCTFSYPLSAQSSLGAQVILLFLSCNSSYDCHIIRPTLKLFLFPFTKPYTTVSKREGSLGWWNIFVFQKEGKWVPKYDKDICIKTNWISKQNRKLLLNAKYKLTNFGKKKKNLITEKKNVWATFNGSVE